MVSKLIKMRNCQIKEIMNIPLDNKNSFSKIFFLQNNLIFFFFQKHFLCCSRNRSVGNSFNLNSYRRLWTNDHSSIIRITKFLVNMFHFVVSQEPTNDGFDLDKSK